VRWAAARPRVVRTLGGVSDGLVGDSSPARAQVRVDDRSIGRLRVGPRCSRVSDADPPLTPSPRLALPTRTAGQPVVTSATWLGRPWLTQGAHGAGRPSKTVR